MVEVVPGSTAGIHLGDGLLSAGGQQVQTVQSLQRLMHSTVIGKDLPITVLCKNALGFRAG